MKIVLISDTHGSFYELKKVAMIENGADLYLHAGDVESFSNEDISPFAAVKGNCDYYSPSFPIERRISTPYGTLLIRHHPVILENDLEEMYKEGIRIFIHGHTHIKENKKYKDMYIICPGSLCRPRDDYASYAVIDVEKGKVEVRFKKI